MHGAFENILVLLIFLYPECQHYFRLKAEMVIKILHEEQDEEAILGLDSDSKISDAARSTFLSNQVQDVRVITFLFHIIISQAQDNTDICLRIMIRECDQLITRNVPSSHRLTR